MDNGISKCSVIARALLNLFEGRFPIKTLKEAKENKGCDFETNRPKSYHYLRTPLKLYLTNLLCIPLLGLLLASCQTTGSQDSDTFIFLDRSDTLFVKFRHSVSPEYQLNYPDIADNMERMRRQDFEIVMEELIQAAQLPMNVQILRKREEPGDGPLLDIFAIRFEQEKSSHFVATLEAKLSKYGELNTLGTYHERQIPPPLLSRDQIDRAFRDVLREPLREIVNDLVAHFETPEEREIVNAPLEELGAN